MTAYRTLYGFRWGPVEVIRVAQDDRLGYVLHVQTDKDAVEIRVTPKGRVLEFRACTVIPKGAGE